MAEGGEQQLVTPERSILAKTAKLVEDPEVKAAMQTATAKLEAKNSELGGKMLAAFGEGPERALVLTQPQELTGSASADVAFLVATSDGYLRLNLGNEKNTACELYDLVNKIIREQQVACQEGTGMEHTGYVREEITAYKLRVKESGSESTPPPPPVKVIMSNLELRVGSLSVDGNYYQGNISFFPTSQEGVEAEYGCVRIEPVTDQAFITEKIRLARETAEKEFAEEQRVRAEQERMEQGAGEKTVLSEEESKRVFATQKDAVMGANQQLDDLLS